MYYSLLVIIGFLIIYFIFKKPVKNNENEDEIHDIDEEQEVCEQEQSKELMLQFNSDAVHFYFYDTYTFHNYMSRNMYEKVIINKLYIDEPFHTIFFQLLQIYDQTESWLKSENTKSLKLKIRKKDATFEKGTSFKVYAVSEIAFNFLDNILQYLRSNRYLKKDEQIIILIALLYKINNVKELKYLCSNCQEEIELRDCIVKALLNKFDKKKRVFSSLTMLENRDEQLQFINEIYKETVASQKEYPFVLKKNEEVKKFSLDRLVNEKEKKLISLDRF